MLPPDCAHARDVENLRFLVAVEIGDLQQERLGVSQGHRFGKGQTSVLKAADADRSLFRAEHDDLVALVAVEIANPHLGHAGKTGERLPGIETLPLVLTEHEDSGPLGIGDHQVGQPIAVDVSQRDVAGPIARLLAAEAGLHETSGRFIVTFLGRLHLQDLETPRLVVDRQDFAAPVAFEVRVGDGARRVDLELQLGPQATGIVLQPGTQRPLLPFAGDIHEILAAVPVDVGHLRQ